MIDKQCYQRKIQNISQIHRALIVQPETWIGKIDN